MAAELERAQATIEAAVKAQVAAAVKTTVTANASAGARTLGGNDVSVLRWIASHPNSRLEEIATGMRRQSATLKPVVARLVRDGHMKKSGAARGTRYRTAGSAVARATAAPGSRSKRVRRSAEDLDKLAARIHAYLGKHPGSRSEEIALALSTPSKELVRPLKLLLSQKAISAKGKARGTQYTASARAPKPSGGGTTTAPRKRAAKRGKKKVAHKASARAARTKAGKRGKKKAASRRRA